MLSAYFTALQLTKMSSQGSSSPAVLSDTSTTFSEAKQTLDGKLA